MPHTFLLNFRKLGKTAFVQIKTSMLDSTLSHSQQSLFFRLRTEDCHACILDQFLHSHPINLVTLKKEKKRKSEYCTFSISNTLLVQPCTSLPFCLLFQTPLWLSDHAIGSKSHILVSKNNSMRQHCNVTPSMLLTLC